MSTPRNSGRAWQDPAQKEHTAQWCHDSLRVWLGGQTGYGSSRGRYQHRGRTGQRHWFRITGLPGWKRAQRGLPAFGRAACASGRPTGLLEKVAEFLRRFPRRRKGNLLRLSRNTN